MDFQVSNLPSILLLKKEKKMSEIHIYPWIVLLVHNIARIIFLYLAITFTMSGILVVIKNSWKLDWTIQLTITFLWWIVWLL